MVSFGCQNHGRSRVVCLRLSIGGRGCSVEDEEPYDEEGDAKQTVGIELDHLNPRESPVERLLQLLVPARWANDYG